jgi:hypothetical protein
MSLVLSLATTTSLAPGRMTTVGVPVEAHSQLRDFWFKTSRRPPWLCTVKLATRTGPAVTGPKSQDVRPVAATGSLVEFISLLGEKIENHKHAVSSIKNGPVVGKIFSQDGTSFEFRMLDYSTSVTLTRVPNKPNAVSAWAPPPPDSVSSRPMRLP